MGALFEGLVEGLHGLVAMVAWSAIWHGAGLVALAILALSLPLIGRLNTPQARLRRKIARAKRIAKRARQGPSLWQARLASPWGWLGRTYWIVLVMVGIALGAGAVWLYLLDIGRIVVDLVARLAEATRSGGTGGGDPEDIRNLAWASSVLLAALAAATALGFRLINVWINERTTRATEEGLTTERITRAVEALGAEKTVSRIGRPVTVTAGETTDTRIEWEDETLAEGETVGDPRDWKAFERTVPNTEVRIGAIYALERIAQDSLRDHVPVMEILSAYLRQNAPAARAAPNPVAERKPERPDNLADKADRGAYLTDLETWRGDLRSWSRDLSPDTVVQTALRVIGRRNDRQRAAERADTRYGAEGYRLDLRATDLRGVDISGLDLSRALLAGTLLEGADLRRAHLEGAFLREAHLAEADLCGAHLEGADLFRAHLEGADFHRAHLKGAELRGAHLEGADLREAHLEGGNLRWAHLEGANLRGAHQEGADLRGAHLEGADLFRAHLEGADLRRAHMSGADFADAVVKFAAVKSVDLSMTNLDQDQGDTLFSDGSVTDAMLPPGVTRPAHWPEADLAPGIFRSGPFYDEWEKWKADPEGYTPPPP